MTRKSGRQIWKEAVQETEIWLYTDSERIAGFGRVIIPMIETELTYAFEAGRQQGKEETEDAPNE